MSAHFDLLPDGVVVADGAGVVTAVNDVARHWLGLTGEPLGQPLAEVLALVDRDGRPWAVVNTPYDGLSTRRGVPEQSWILPDGGEVLVSARINRASADAPITSVGIVLRSGRGRARLDRDRSDLVATVAHELRSPLTGVKGFVQAMLNRWDKLSDDQKKLMLTTVHSDSERLSRLITELLDVARIDTGRLSIYPRPTDPRALVERVVATARAGTSREVRIEGPEGLPEVVVDPDKLIQVLTNLVENGLRHGAGAVTVRLGVPTPDEPTVVRVDVEDEGEGIDPEMRRRAVTKFWTAGQGAGSGLGLYIVNGLVTAHGGELEIGSTSGGGARITIHLPTEAAADVPTGSRTRHTPS